MWLGNQIDNMRYGGGAGDLHLLKVGPNYQAFGLN
eukprot:CAMPEP_0119473152 /NCGR_PEP_ID=MMETSP1344-20130328/4917_1 /TAXON_ID=236787 /ORGANISM="Florenciella parvula, Strain CCMP2471" /LENGTH=34 /DNA_ID= /DNA_START= /DNA_END= /DNA_ORIENTATION=